MKRLDAGSIEETIERLEPGEYHWREGITFKRLEDGSVRVCHLEPNEIDGCTETIDWVIPPAEWVSIVASVTPCGETSETRRASESLHQGKAK